MGHDEKGGNQTTAAKAGPAAISGRPSSIPRVDVHTLLGSGREAILVLGESDYRLRLTNNGKLILTK